MNDKQAEMASDRKKGFRGVHVLWIVLGTIMLTAALTYWAISTYVYAKDFQPVQLDQQEEQVLTGKLRALGYQPEPSAPVESPETDAQWLRPEAYDEAGGKREIGFSERELNALIAKDQQLARKLAVDLSDDLVSLRVLVPVDPDFPLLGGKTLRVAAGVELAYQTARPRVVLKGVSVMGVPVPNAWLGGLKNVDLIGEFGDEQGFWSSFSQGVEDISVVDCELRLKLRE